MTAHDSLGRTLHSDRGNFLPLHIYIGMEAKMKHTHFIVETIDGLLTPRRNVGRPYMNRIGTTVSLDDCRVFNTKAAATNSARQAGYDNTPQRRFHVIGFNLGEAIPLESLIYR